MTIPVQEILDRVTDLLLDKDRADDEARWSNDELIRWINDSRMAIITRKPSACSKIVTVALVAGSHQTVPSNGVQLLDIICNMGMDGSSPGRSIRRTDRQNLDDDDLYWQSAAQKVEISQFTYDDRTPKDYFVSPPAKAGTQIKLSHAAIPDQVSTTADTLDVGLEVMDAVVNGKPRRFTREWLRVPNPPEDSSLEFHYRRQKQRHDVCDFRLSVGDAVEIPYTEATWQNLLSMSAALEAVRERLASMVTTPEFREALAAGTASLLSGGGT